MFLNQSYSIFSFMFWILAASFWDYFWWSLKISALMSYHSKLWSSSFLLAKHHRRLDRRCKWSSFYENVGPPFNKNHWSGTSWVRTNHPSTFAPLLLLSFSFWYKQMRECSCHEACILTGFYFCTSQLKSNALFDEPSPSSQHSLELHGWLERSMSD